MATQTATTTIPPPASQPPPQQHSQYSPPDSIELSVKTPRRKLREISQRITGHSKSNFHHQPTLEGDEDVRNDVPPPVTAQTAVQRWNQPRGNIGRLAAAFFSFIIAGMNDASVGALIPYLESHYNLTYTIVSLIFLTPFAGYSVAAFANASIHTRLGQRGIAILAPVCHITTYAILSAHPPFPVVVIANAIAGFGNGLTDACFCAWVGSMANANAVQGCLHSMYSVGATFAPLIATSMVVKAGLPWWSWYYVMTGASFLELALLASTFWHKTGLQYRIDHPRTTTTHDGRTKEALKSKITWLCSLFFFTYMGIEVGLGGWIVTFMLRERSASPYSSGISATGFWAGQAAGRAGLGFVTDRFGERRCVSVYLAICIALQLIFWLVPRFVVSAVAVALLGVFLGPLFPANVIMATKLLPSHLHVSSIGFGTAIGGTGGTVFPFMVGAIAAKAGVKVLQPIILALLVILAAVWISFPRIKKRE